MLATNSMEQSQCSTPIVSNHNKYDSKSVYGYSYSALQKHQIK